MQPKTHVKVSLITYILITIIIVGGHSIFASRGFHLDYTISRYIGLSAWSALLFLATSIFIFINVIKYLKYLKVAENLSTFWWIIAMITMVSLIGVGLCPLGYFDQTYGEFGAVSIMHRISSATMFCFSILLILLTIIKIHQEKRFLIACLLYIIYGCFFVICYSLNLQFFMENIFIFEATILASFYIVLLCKQDKNTKEIPE